MAAAEAGIEADILGLFSPGLSYRHTFFIVRRKGRPFRKYTGRGAR
ncbi:MAG: hypothetical protein KHW62_01080 [Clostridiales bacterium]|nr:hypothetical protein [Clostridiales bacterium]